MDRNSVVRIGILGYDEVIDLQQFVPLLESLCPKSRVVVSVFIDLGDRFKAKRALSDAEIANLNSSEILIADQRLINYYSLSLEGVKWVQTFWAGVDWWTRNIDTSQVPNYVLTRNGVSFVEDMAEYVMSHILACERHHRQYDENQKKKIWQADWKLIRYRKLSTLSLGILGLGAIGKEIARMAKSMNMTVWGLVRTLPSEEKQSPHVDAYRLVADLPELLSSCDYVCSILPSTKETDGLLDGDTLSHCKNKKSVFINIGRGNVVKNETIARALDEGWLRHAVLDVFETEPLPEDSVLWTRPDVTITPHVAGCGIDTEEFVKEFAANYKRYRSGEPMNYVVDWTKGY